MEEHLIIKFYNDPKKRKKMYNRYKTLKNKKKLEGIQNLETYTRQLATLASGKKTIG